MEVDVREQFLIDERLRNYREMVEAHRMEQMSLIERINSAAS